MFSCFRILLLVSLYFAIHGLTFAKGMDEIKPKTPEDVKSEGAEQEAGDADESDEKATDGESQEDTESAKSGETAGKVTAETKPAPSSLDDKVFIQTGFGWVRAYAEKGSWRANGMSDITFGYKIPVFKKLPGTLHTTIRFAPIAVNVHDAGIAYDGDIAIWEGGARFTYSLNKSLNAFGDFGIGAARVNLHRLGNSPGNKDLTESGASVSVGGGAEWFPLDKFSLGPRVHFGVGRFTIAQYMLSTQFYF